MVLVVFSPGGASARLTRQAAYGIRKLHENRLLHFCSEEIAMRLTPASELTDRIRRLQAEMAVADLEAVLILQNADLFYFTGSIQQGVLYVPVAGEPLYLVRKEHSRARMESGLKQIVPLKSPKDIPGLLAEHGL